VPLVVKPFSAPKHSLRYLWLGRDAALTVTEQPRSGTFFGPPGLTLQDGPDGRKGLLLAPGTQRISRGGFFAPFATRRY
jgi:hypothetical protein